MTEIIEDTDEYQIVRTYSDAGWADTTVWKPGFGPTPDPTVVTLDPATVQQVKTALTAATTIAGVKNALGPLLDALGTG